MPQLFTLSDRPVSREMADELPPGLYAIDEEPIIAEAYDAPRHEMRTGWTRMLLRIDDGIQLPQGVEEARFRADGKRVVIGRVFDDTIQQTKGSND